MNNRQKQPERSPKEEEPYSPEQVLYTEGADDATPAKGLIMPTLATQGDQEDEEDNVFEKRKVVKKLSSER